MALAVYRPQNDYNLGCSPRGHYLVRASSKRLVSSLQLHHPCFGGLNSLESRLHKRCATRIGVAIWGGCFCVVAKETSENHQELQHFLNV